ncbi:hypothetical protein N0V95_006667 [Ascochyta clinopodiicola]|nr:hypothetical protein N0V95_006667 [Ascochyta clinopodiicola]
MTDEPMNKRRRVDEGSSLEDARNGGDVLSPASEVQGIGYGYENTDPFLSPATASSWPFDEFAHDPDYLASQEALRSLMFNTARSAAPTRAGTPVHGDDMTSVNFKHVLTNGRRIQYLKNYMSQVAPWDWRRHLEGCAAVFEAFGVNGFSSDVLQAVFWCYARMDVCGALISDGTENTLLRPSAWLPHGMTDEDAEALFRGSKVPDMYANHAVYLCAKTCELISDRNKYTELGAENGWRLLSHSSEQALVVKTIRRIELLTGWTATWRIRDLESTWGYRIRGEL